MALCFFYGGGYIAFHSLMSFKRVEHKMEAETFTALTQITHLRGWEEGRRPGILSNSGKYNK